MIKKGDTLGKVTGQRKRGLGLLRGGKWGELTRTYRIEIEMGVEEGLLCRLKQQERGVALHVEVYATLEGKVMPRREADRRAGGPSCFSCCSTAFSSK